MKRALLILAALVLVACVGFTQEILYRDEATLMWDDATEYLPEDTVEYEVYIYDSATVVSDQIIANLIFVGTTQSLEMLIVFPERRNWYAGVRTKLTTGEPRTTYSAVSWSYDVEVAISPFVYQPQSGAVSPPDNLRDSGM